jgi:hypothetical protein
MQHAMFQRYTPIMPGIDPFRIQQAHRLSRYRIRYIDCPTCDVRQATQYFRIVDTNFSGTLSKKEFARVLKESGLGPSPGEKKKQERSDHRYSQSNSVDCWRPPSVDEHGPLLAQGDD